MSRSIHDLIDLSGRTALITGACGKLGSIFAETLAELGCSLILVDLDIKKLQDLKLSLEEFNVPVKIHVADLEKSEARVNLHSETLGEEKTLDLLINNAAFVGSSSLSGWSTSFENQTVETWRRALEVNLVAVFELTQLCYQNLLKSKDGNIINIGSIYGFNAPVWSLYANTDMSNPAAYAASKGGLLQLTKWLAATLAPIVRVNSISPGGIFNFQPESFVSNYVQRTPLGRMADPEDFVGAIVYLATGMSSYVTGTNLVIDGGWSI
jgi:NAD(P)-dependent dehydrogenase (short-subunit alcohol dehydrogenase family)